VEIAQVTIAPESGGHLPPGLPPGEARAGEFLQLLLALLGAVKPPAAPAGAGSGPEDAGEDHPPAGEETAVTPGNRGGVPDGAPVLAGLPGAVTPAAGVVAQPCSLPLGMRFNAGKRQRRLQGRPVLLFRRRRPRGCSPPWRRPAQMSRRGGGMRRPPWTPPHTCRYREVYGLSRGRPRRQNPAPAPPGAPRSF
jgi:hypothetical protein